MVWKPPPPNSKASKVWLEFVDDPDTKYFFLEGAVRSSKTFGSILAWCDWVENFAPKGPLIMMGNTRETLIQNAIHPLIELVGSQNAVLNRGIGTLKLFGREIYLFGAGNIIAMRKLQGKGAVGAYCDEAPTYPKDVWEMLGTRTAAEGIKIIATMNPDNPRHYMKMGYLDRLEEVNGRSWHFTLDDNPFLSEKVKNELKRQYTGLWYKRYILGLWVAAEGAVYDMFNEDAHVIHALPKRWARIVVGVDFGISSVTSFVMIGQAAEGPYMGKWIVSKEYYHDATKKHQKTDTEISKDMVDFLKHADGRWYPESIEVDPSASPLKVQLRRDGFTNIRDADNEVKAGIMDVSSAFSSGKLLIHDSCTNLLTELPGYCWDTKAQEQGEDKPIKVNDHALDALRYACRRIFKKRLS
jgi:PBSX family phage terminase large subunit